MVRFQRRTLFVAVAGATGVVVGGKVLNFVAPRYHTKLRALPSILLDSVSFSIREMPKEITSFVIVDCDGTLYRADSTLDALRRKYGENGAKMHLGLLSAVKEGRLSIDEALISGFRALVNAPGGFNIYIWNEIVDDFRKRNLFRRGLIDALCEMQSRYGTIVIIATKASEQTAKYIAHCLDFGFDQSKTFFAGTRSIVNNSDIVTDIAELIGMEDGTIDGIRVKTKVTRTEEILVANSLQFRHEATAVISNDLLDTKEMLRAGRGILIVPATESERTGFEKAAVDFGLYDIICLDNSDDLMGQRLKRELIVSLAGSDQ